jgi:hypothetical protein
LSKDILSYDVNRHLSDADLDAFRRRAPDPNVLIELDRHLADCADCRARLRSQSAASGTVAWLQHEISEAGGGGHLNYDDVRALAEGHSVPDAARHAAGCPSCRAEVEDLRAAIGQVPRRRRWYWAVAAAILLAVASPLIWKSWHSPANAEFTARVQDDGGTVALDRKGKLHTSSALAPADAAAVAEALRTGRLTTPEVVLELNRQKERLLGSGGTSARTFTLREPVGEAVLTGRPRFTWDRLEGAATYRVRVYDEEFRRLAESPPVSATEWTADRDLDAGHMYSWTVTADVGGQEIRAPLPPAPEAKFAVPSGGALAHIAEARRLHPEAHLLLASLYAGAGAWKQARAELEALSRTNPDSAVVRGLEASLPHK